MIIQMNNNADPWVSVYCVQKIVIAAAFLSITPSVEREGCVRYKYTCQSISILVRSISEYITSCPTFLLMELHFIDNFGGGGWVREVAQRGM